MVASVKGYKPILVMPESTSVERRRLMQAYGATFDLIPREKGMRGAIARAEELAAKNPGSWIPQQFENPANVEVHARTTAQEILADFPEGMDAIITGVGTGGHITAFGEMLKPRWPDLRVFAVELAVSTNSGMAVPIAASTSARSRSISPRWRMCKPSNKR